MSVRKTMRRLPAAGPFLMRSSWNLSLPKSGDIWSGLAALQIFLLEKILGMDQPFHYRNKAQFPVGKSKAAELLLDFNAGRTHSIIENRDCALGVTRNKEVLDRCDCVYGEVPYSAV